MPNLPWLPSMVANGRGRRHVSFKRGYDRIQDVSLDCRVIASNFFGEVKREHSHNHEYFFARNIIVGVCEERG